MTITAQFDATCRDCGKPIKVGDEMEWQKGVPGAAHVNAAACKAAPAAPPDESWEFRSKSDPTRKPYVLTKSGADGTLRCDCRGWINKQVDAPRTCTHVKQKTAELGWTLERVGDFLRVVSGDAEKYEGVKAKRKFDAPFEKGKVVTKPKPTPGVAAPAPMLASAMTTPVTGKAFDKAYAGWVLEEKLDGHRVVAVVQRVGAPGDAGRVSAWSRPRAGETAKRRELPPHIVAQLASLAPGIYDGELVMPGGKSWNVTEIGNASKLVLVLFDALEMCGNNLLAWPYGDRRKALLDQLGELPDGQCGVSTVESVPATWKLVEAIWKRGGEGAIVKRVDSPYRPGARSADWIKVKQIHAAVMEVAGFEAGKNGPQSAFKLWDASIQQFTTCKVLNNAMLREVAADPASFLGRRVVVQFQERTPSGLPRHIRFDHFAGAGE